MSYLLKTYNPIYYLYLICCSVLVLFIFPFTLHGQSLSFLGYSTEKSDTFTLIALDSIYAGQEIYLTDKGWDGNDFFVNGESTLKWICPQIDKGTIFTINKKLEVKALNKPYLDAGQWFDQKNKATQNGLNLFAGDQILIYTKIRNQVNFITAFHADYNPDDFEISSGWNNGQNNYNTSSSRKPENLNELNSICFSSNVKSDISNAFYSGPNLIGTKEDILSELFKYENWTINNGSQPNSFDIELQPEIAPIITPIKLAFADTDIKPIPFKQLEYKDPNPNDSLLFWMILDYSTNLKLFIDINSNGIYDGTDIKVESNVPYDIQYIHNNKLMLGAASSGKATIQWQFKDEKLWSAPSTIDISVYPTSILTDFVREDKEYFISPNIYRSIYNSQIQSDQFKSYTFIQSELEESNSINNEDISSLFFGKLNALNTNIDDDKAFKLSINPVYLTGDEDFKLNIPNHNRQNGWSLLYNPFYFDIDLNVDWISLNNISPFIYKVEIDSLNKTNNFKLLDRRIETTQIPAGSFYFVKSLTDNASIAYNFSAQPESNESNINEQFIDHQNIIIELKDSEGTIVDHIKLGLDSFDRSFEKDTLQRVHTVLDSYLDNSISIKTVNGSYKAILLSELVGTNDKIDPNEFSRFETSLVYKTTTSLDLSIQNTDIIADDIIIQIKDSNGTLILDSDSDRPYHLENVDKRPKTGHYTLIIANRDQLKIEDNQLVENFVLHQNFPNPFNPTTTIKYELEESQTVYLDVIDIKGQVVAVLENKVKSAGSYQTVFDASTLPSGVYLARLRVGNQNQIIKMTLLK